MTPLVQRYYDNLISLLNKEIEDESLRELAILYVDNIIEEIEKETQKLYDLIKQKQKNALNSLYGRHVDAFTNREIKDNGIKVDGNNYRTSIENIVRVTILSGESKWHH